MYNNYNPYLNNGFNPNFRPMEQQYPQNNINVPTMQQNTLNMPKSALQGKQVDSLEVVKATDVPFDGSISYFPLTDGSAIVSKQLQTDGTSKIVVYKPTQADRKEAIQFATLEDIQEAINEIDLSDIQDLKDDVREIKKQLKEFKTKKSKDDE
jgi:hypothetical protein